ncbi:antiviral innate immune response receptor RIG-I-like isoform X2 [Physella acuta]|uniref:antiviral innate immune response receptor RIG-I-like isoform X2 n=1 Tax=Physella acuta TaxID=109671 RepID=UPI0027DDFC9E|nr:antiviral innate immune response receptor RIG-I-like isoform X2 [Physella acuta]
MDTSTSTDEPNVQDVEVAPDLHDAGVHCDGIYMMRKYQLELAEKAATKGVNTIICSPAGSGKTLTASYIIIDHLMNAKGAKKSKVAVLAKTTFRASNMLERLCGYLPEFVKKVILIGKSKENWDLKRFADENDIVVMTPMVLLNNIQFKDFQLNEFSLLIIDECHNTRCGDYYSLMLKYIQMKYKNNGMQSQMESLPQVVGLTSSIGIEKAKNLEQAVTSILTLMTNLDVYKLSVVEYHIDDLKKFLPGPESPPEKLEKQEEDELVKKINSIMMQLEKHMEKNAQELNNQMVLAVLKKKPSGRKSKSYKEWVVQLINAVKTYPIVDPESETNTNTRNLIIICEYLQVYNLALEIHDLVELKDIMPYLKKIFDKFHNYRNKTQEEAMLYGYFEDFIKLVDSWQGNENTNLTTLSKTLEENLIPEECSRGIIFVSTRLLAKALVSWLNRSNKSFLNASVFTGTCANEHQGGRSPMVQIQILQQFYTGVIRLLVATSAAGESFDIPLCNLIIRYNFSGNEVSTKQTTGRCIAEGGKSVLLAMEDILKEELRNTERTKLISEAISVIDRMDTHEIIQRNSYFQLDMIKKDEIAEAEKKMHKKDPREVPCNMVCFLCRQVSIDCSLVRTIKKRHRIFLDSDLLKSGKVRFKPNKPKTSDEVDFLGPVLCQGEIEGKGVCGNALGSLIMYRNVKFLTMGIKAFGFCMGTNTALQYFKKWDKVPYNFDELTPYDTKSYLESCMDGDSLDQWPATTSAGHMPAITSAGDIPATSSAGEIPPTSSAGHIPAITSAGHIPATSSAGHIPAITSAGHVPRTSSAGHVPATTSAGHVPRTSSAGHMPATTSAGHIPPTSSAGEIPPTRSAGDIPPTISAGHMPATISAGHMPPTSSAGHILRTSSAGDICGM